MLATEQKRASLKPSTLTSHSMASLHVLPYSSVHHMHSVSGIEAVGHRTTSRARLRRRQVMHLLHCAVHYRARGTFSDLLSRLDRQDPTKTKTGRIRTKLGALPDAIYL